MGLNKVKSNFDTPIKLTKEAIHDLQWCMKNLYTASEKVQYPGIKKVIYTDWWGAYCEGMPKGGSWINTEKNWHINAIELKSILLNLMSVFKDHGIHIKISSDSTTALAYVNKLSTSH